MATVKELKDAGQLDEALELALDLYESDKENIFYRNSLLWVYDALCKRAAEAGDLDDFSKRAKQIGNMDGFDDAMISKTMCWRLFLLIRKLRENEKNSATFNLLFKLAKELNLEKPSEEYTILFKAFLHFKACEEFKDFCYWWNFDNFRSQDYEDEQLPNGRKVMSVVEQAYIAHSKILLQTRDKEKIDDFLPRLQALAECYPKMSYPGYYCAKLMLAEGDTDSALGALLPFAQKKKTEFWIWQLLGEIYVKKEIRITLACYIRAVKCHTDEKFLVKVRQQLAKTLIAMQRYDEAKFQIDKVIKCVNVNGNKMPSPIMEWSSQEWYKAAKPKESLNDVDYMAITDNLLYADLPCRTVVVSFVNKDKGIANVVYGREETGFFKYSKFVKKVNVGDLLDLRISRIGDNNRLDVVAAVAHDGKFCDSDYYQQIEGEVLANNDRTFYHLDAGRETFYIPLQAVKEKGLDVGDTIRACALYEYNRKRGNWGWRCISIIKM